MQQAAKLTKIAAVICALLALPAAPAAAVAQFFTDEAQFLAAGGAGLNFEGFNDRRAQSSIQAYTGFTLAEELGNSNSMLSSLGNNVMPSALVEGSGYVFYDDNGNSRAVFTFASPINAFGIFVASNFDAVAGAQGNIAIIGNFGTGAGNQSLTLTINQPQFWGVIADTAFTTVTFNMPMEPIVAFDALRHGTIIPPVVVPEPDAWALLLAGFGLTGATMRRRRATVV